MSRPKKDMSLARIIGRNLYELRTANGLKQKDVAHACGCSLSALNFAESGQVEPTLLTLRRLADFYGVTIDKITTRQAEI